MPSSPLKERPLPPGAGGAAVSISATEREGIRTWLQLVKAVLPLEREVNKMFAREFGQSLPRFDVLNHLDREGDGGLSVGMLAERLIASAGNITRLVTRMVGEGLVTRVPDERDRRREIVCITSKGRELYREMSEAHAQWAGERFGALSAEDQEAIRDMMRRLRRG